MSTRAEYQAIVVGIDGTATALAAARWAAALADRERVPLVLLSVAPAFDHPLTASALAETTLMLSDFRTAAKHKIEAAFAAVHRDQPQVEVHQVVEDGIPARILIEHSVTARMIVVAADLGDRLSTLLLGSTALMVANKATSPVTVWRGATDRPLPDHRPVLVGVDGSPGSSAAVGAAFELASILRVGVLALHAWNDPDLLQWTPVPDAWATLAEQERELLSERVAGWSEKYPDVTVTKVVQKSPPARALLEYAERAQAVLTGSRGHNRLTGLLIGSTSQNLLHHAPCPVVVCREP
ncbi:universal stress protein [Nocardia sp. NPDC049220]|uniref:universal stress protein n=1 Tax=Nocardia sp. NPDC049220 TaxID=3155273 RepID=UPI0033E1304E